MAFNSSTARITTDVTLTTIGATPTGALTHTLIGLSVANKMANSCTVRVSLNDGVNDTYLVYDVSIPPGSTLAVVGGDQKVVLTNGDTIKVYGDKGSNGALAIDVVMSFLEG